MRDGAEVLQAVADSFIAKLEARPSFSVPRRRSIQWGSAPFDCEELIVAGIGTYQGVPGRRDSGYSVATAGLGMYSMDLTVTLVRAVPSIDNAGRPPSESSLTHSALASATDATALTEAFWLANTDGSIVSPCDWMYFGGVAPVGPLGGLAGALLSMSVQL